MIIERKRCKIMSLIKSSMIGGTLVSSLFFSSFLYAASAMSNKTDSSGAVEAKKFLKAMDDIQKYYVFAESKKTLFENAIRGMVNELDPHCAYLDKEDFQELKEMTKGEFAGIGLEVTMEHGLVRVISPLDGTPAQKAGIKAGDYIIKLNKKSVVGLTLRAAVNEMRGPADSVIRLEVVRKGSTKPITFILKRKIIHIQSVKAQRLETNYAYVKLAQFQSSTPDEMYNAIEELKKQGHIQGLILDLRNDPGGLLTSAVAVADDFLDGKKNKSTLIVYAKGRWKGSKFKAVANPGDIIPKVPMVILINNGSASAAEIVAGALKDNHRAVLVGTKTFGKGSVQTVIPLGQESAIKLTTALYYTPSGVSIQAEGITPDIIVKQLTLKFKTTPNEEYNISESDLEGHLAAAINKVADVENSKNDIQLLSHDYQLSQALNVLKGMALDDDMNK